MLAVLGYLAYVNLILALFNLIPGFPLDGGRVFRAILWHFSGNLRRATHIASTAGQVIGYLFIFGGLLEAFALGQVLSGIWLAFIGWFLQTSAGASYQQAVMDRVLMGVDVHDVMDRLPTTILPTTSIAALVFDNMLNQNQRAIPVQGPDGRLRGLVTMHDIQKVPRDRWESTPVTVIMTPLDELRTVGPSDDLRNALRVLAENRYHQLPVVENDRAIGMLNRAHVLQYIHLREKLAEQHPEAMEDHTSRRAS